MERQRQDAAEPLRPPKRIAIKLPPLLIRLMRLGKTVRVIPIPDPRERFLAAYNELGAKTGDSAEPA